MNLFEHTHRGNVWRLEVVEYQGRTFANLRRWYYAPDGELKPSRDGFTFPPERLVELGAAIVAFIDGRPVDGMPQAT